MLLWHYEKHKLTKRGITVKYLRLGQISQVKTSSFVENNASRLFIRFRISSILSSTNICKEKGYSVEGMLYLMLLIILDGAKSMYSGILDLQKEKLKSPLNNLLNNETYNWRNLLYRVCGVFAKQCPTPEGKISALIIDDTAKEKTGRKGENCSWFRDHCRNAYYKGFQVIMAVWSNGVTAIPVDFELKIGKSRIKHAKKSHYHKGTHTEQRERMAKGKKTHIAIALIKRALQRKFRFRYLLWDSWYNCSASLHYIFESIVPKSIHLVAMVKRDHQKYLFRDKYLAIKEIYRAAGKWRIHDQTGIKFKSVIVAVLDKRNNKNPEEQEVMGYVRMCFFKYPTHKDFKVVISTDLELTELEVLGVYLRRWAVEVVFKDLKQYFGFDQSKSSKYAPQIADLAIRCVFYTMFCALKYDCPEKSTEQLVIEFFSEMQDNWLDILCGILFQQKTKLLLEYAVQLGYNDIKSLANDLDKVLAGFFEKHWYEDKIEEVDINDYCKYLYREAI